MEDYIGKGIARPLPPFPCRQISVILTTRVSLCPNTIPSNKTTVATGLCSTESWYEGEPFEFNFSKFWTFTKTTFSSEETDNEILWHVAQENLKARMETEIRCKKSDMLFVNYEDPHGVKRFDKLWNGGNGYGNVKLYRKRRHKLELIDDMKCGHVGCEYGEFAEN